MVLIVVTDDPKPMPRHHPSQKDIERAYVEARRDADDAETALRKRGADGWLQDFKRRHQIK